MSDLTKLVPVPHPSAINTGVSPCPTSALLRRYGYPKPYASIGTNCDNRNLSPSWQQRILTEDVGPFKATGHRCAVAHLRITLADVKREKPELYAALGSMGMLCVRWVRGHQGVLSNHGLGLAIDFTIDGVLDPYGDGKCQAGLLDLYAIFKRHKWFWGAEFGKEDSMHMEISSELVMEWIRTGAF